jgi:endonuclease YncB( thermonuclease family)
MFLAFFATEHNLEMKIIRTSLLVFAVAGGLALAAPADESLRRDPPELPVPGPVPARLLRVVDGDTIRVRAHIWLGQDVETMVRLSGVDAAEKHAHCDYERDMARKAQDFVEAKLADDRISLADITYDKYGRRVVARVLTASGEDLSTALLGAPLCWGPSWRTATTAATRRAGAAPRVERKSSDSSARRRRNRRRPGANRWEPGRSAWPRWEP